MASLFPTVLSLVCAVIAAHAETLSIRTYTVAGGMEKVPEIARRYGLTVSLGCWISADLDQNETELTLCIKTALANRRVIDRVFVGNEAILFGFVTPDQLNGYIKRVRDALPSRIKVTTAEPWSTWLLTPEIGQYVDVVCVHLLPYWEGVPARDSLGFLQRAYNDVQQEFPDKPIVVGEAGWPSEGRSKKTAEASLANEAYFMRAFVQLAMEKGYDYYLHSYAFLTKITLFVILGALSVIPTQEFLSWSASIKAGQAPVLDARQKRLVSSIIHGELAAIVVILLCAAVTARGGWV